jgi:hypothetical protein
MGDAQQQGVFQKPLTELRAYLAARGWTMQGKYVDHGPVGQA